VAETDEPSITLVRHGATEWSENGRHTSFTDLPLLAAGRDGAAHLAGHLRAEDYGRALSSPLARARETAALAGFPSAELSEDLTEWNYGEYEGLTSPQIHETVPDWNLWRDGCPGGESPQDVAARADRVIADVVAARQSTIVFAHGHFLRALAARWAEHPVTLGERLYLAPSTISRLGHEHATRVIEHWNSAV
jgi:broad specificity phosphatase PhoE